MPAPSSFNTGIRNVVASTIDYLKAQITGEAILGSQYLQASEFPCITVEDAGLFSLGDDHFSEIMKNAAGVLTFGKIEQTQLEINCMAKLTASVRDPVRKVRELYDRLRYTFLYAGMPAQAGGFILPAINLLDYENGKTDTGALIWHPRELDNVWIPAFIKDEGNPPIWRYRIYVRIYWEQYRQDPAP